MAKATIEDQSFEFEMESHFVNWYQIADWYQQFQQFLTALDSSGICEEFCPSEDLGRGKRSVKRRKNNKAKKRKNGKKQRKNRKTKKQKSRKYGNTGCGVFKGGIQN